MYKVSTFLMIKKDFLDRPSCTAEFVGLGPQLETNGIFSNFSGILNSSSSCLFLNNDTLHEPQCLSV